MRKYLVSALAVLAVVSLLGGAAAKTYNVPNIDGHVTISENDWDVDEFAYDDPNNDNRYYPTDGDLDALFVTWDADNLYVGIRTTNGPGDYGNGYLLFIDTDAQNGITGAVDFRSADFYARNLTFSTMGADVVMGGWNLPVNFDVKHCSDPTSTTNVVGVTTQCNPGWQHIEAAIPWDSIYGLGAGVVPSGTTLRFIAAVVGGDGAGAYDAMPTTVSGVESISTTPWNQVIDLDVYYEAVVDEDGDGVPDEGFPPGGSIAGTVTLDDDSDTETVVTVSAYAGGELVASTHTAPGGGAYELLLLPDDTYSVSAEAQYYLGDSETGIVIEDEAEITGIDFLLTRVDGTITGTVALSGGPAEDVTVTAYDTVTGAVAGNGAQTVPGGFGSFTIETVLDGSYSVEAVAKGYVEALASADVVDEGTANVGELSLDVVVATHYAYLDSLGNTVYSAGTTVSIPDESLYHYARVQLEPRDDGDRVAYWDDTYIDTVHMSATRLDPAYPPIGNIVFADENRVPLAGGAITPDMFEDARAPLYIAGDEVEIVRVLASRGRLVNVLEVGIGPPEPAKLELSADTYTIAAGDSVARITGQLVDASGNVALLSGVVANMTTVSAMGVGGGFTVDTPETDANGRFELGFSGSAAGTAYVTAVFESGSPYEALEVDTLAIEIVPGSAARVELAASPSALTAGGTAIISARVADEWGNTVEQSGLSIALQASPSGLLESLTSPLVTDADGTATGTAVAGTHYGVVMISGAATIPVDTVYLPIDATIIAVDEAAPESDPAHNSDAGIDLTVMKATNSADSLVVTLDFSSVWTGAHLGLAIEANGDAAGATPEPFTFPINYGHALLPDYAYTYKYYDQSYGDFRKWNGTGWEFYDSINDIWSPDWVEGADNGAWATVTDTDVRFRIPLAAIGVAVGDTVRLEAYAMQEDGEKRTALDSTPGDATHDMTPDTGEWWETATTPVTLSSYAEYVIAAEGFPPLLTTGAAAPSTASPDDEVVYTVRVADGGGGIGDVFINLSELGGAALTRMLDDGLYPDAGAGDGVYTASSVVTSAAADGPASVTVTARDAANIWPSALTITLTIDNPATAIRSFDDAVGDDHGPNQTDGSGNPVEGLYYYYPTNFVFQPGSFDITRVEISRDGSWVVFRTYIEDLVNHQSEGAADWGAPQPNEQTCDDPGRTDMNLQKLDIYIDTSEGEGSTSGFPNRYTDVALVDAWEYGISVEGWGKWFVASNGANSQASWTLSKSDNDIRLCNSHIEDFIDVRVHEDLFEGAADSASILNWDIIVCLSTHDGDSSDENLGGIRWVNGSTSEWNVGGGRDSEGGRDRDANIIDVAVSAGGGKESGRTQEDMLDYTTPEAIERFDNSKVAVVLEASFAEDTSPPIITAPAGDERVKHIPWVALNGAPAVVWTEITDMTGVEEATLYWHTYSDTARRAVEMVNLAGDIWAADIPRDEIVSAAGETELNVTGNARMIIVNIHAVDASSNANAIWAGPYEMGLPEPWADSQTIPDIEGLVDEQGVAQLVFQDGTVVNMADLVFLDGLEHLSMTLEPVPESLVNVENIRGDMEFVGAARRIDAGYARDEVYGNMTLTMHYPQYDVGGLNESRFGIFTWNEETERWIFVAAANSSENNTVAADVSDLGLFGVFYWDALEYGSSNGLSGVMAEPNPFSPNGDGLYDETRITFYLGREADHVNIELFDLAGKLARRLVWHQPADYTGGTPVEIVWDGRDADGHVVPYGLYVMRAEAKFKTEPTYERINLPVAVIK